MPSDMKLRAEIRRYDPTVDTEPHYETYEVAGKDNWRVLDVIRSIYENQAGDLAYQFACRVGRCGTCAVKVNGVPVLACQERCKSEMKIEPLTPFPVLRDLVVDRSEVEARYEEHAFAPQRATEYKGGPEPIEPRLAEDLCHMGSCLACMVCVSGCPAVEQRAFDGPAFMLKLRHMAVHPADAGNRLAQAIDAGMLECFGCDLCTQLCPADLSPAQAIRDFRREMIFGKGQA
jgi:fumarate reductase (CoM/CoB) subunit B